MKKYCLIGEKLSHSYSADIHMSEGFNYTLQEVKPNQLEDFVKNNVFDGFNITIPYKQAIIPFLDYVSPCALKANAVNTVVKKEGKLLGYNTDLFGSYISIKKSGIDIKGKNVLILGKGGAGNALGCLMSDMGASSVNYVTRKGDIDYSNVYEKCPNADVIINATPYGLYPMLSESPILDVKKFDNLALVFDLIYNPFRTSLLLEAKKRKIKPISGLYMLVGQAVKAEYIWKNEETDESDVSISTVNRIYKKLLNSKLNMYFVGMPGSGKSSVAREVALKTNRQFIDTDEEIKKKCSLSHSEFINKYGEEPFRDIESSVISECVKKKSVVVSLGGGAVLRSLTRSLIAQTGIVYYINRDIDKLSLASRPLSVKYGLENLYNQRFRFYEEVADCVVDNNSCINKAVNSVLSYRVE